MNFRRNRHASFRGVLHDPPSEFIDGSHSTIRFGKFNKNDLINQMKIAAIGAGVGFVINIVVTKIAFAAAAIAVTNPAVIAIPVAVIVSAISANVIKTLVSSRIRKTPLEANWWKKAIYQGFLAGAVGGLIGATIAHFIPHDALSNIIHHLFSRSPPPVAHLPVGPPVLVAPVMPHVDPQSALSDFVHSSDFQKLSPSMQKLGNAALKSGHGALTLHFYKEASFQMLNRRHTAAAHALGAKLLKYGADSAHALGYGADKVYPLGLKDVNAKMLLRDEVYLERVNRAFTQPTHIARALLPGRSLMPDHNKILAAVRAVFNSASCLSLPSNRLTILQLS